MDDLNPWDGAWLKDTRWGKWRSSDSTAAAVPSLGRWWCDLYDKRRQLLDEVAVITRTLDELEQYFPPAGGVS